MAQAGGALRVGTTQRAARMCRNDTNRPSRSPRPRREATLLEDTREKPSGWRQRASVYALRAVALPVPPAEPGTIRGPRKRPRRAAAQAQ